MDKTNFDQLLERYLNNQVTEEERAKIEMWLNVRKYKGTTNLELSKVDEEKLFKKIMDKTASTTDVKSFPGTKPKPPGWILPLTVSILVLISMGIGGYWFQLNKTTNQFITTTQQTIQKVILDDGSLVWLKPNSQLTFDKDTNGTRQASLEGEALFEVAKDPEHPFIILCNGSTVQVVGTSFNLKSTKDNMELNVLTGSVRVTLPDNTIHELMPNEKIAFREGTTNQKIPITEIEKQKLIINTEYNMDFESEKLEYITSRLQKKFDADIRFENPQIKSCRITANLTDHSLESSLERITDVLDINIEYKQEYIYITGNGCQRPN